MSKKEAEEEEKDRMRQVRRKQVNPQPNKTDFGKEDDRIGQNVDDFLKEGVDDPRKTGKLDMMQTQG